MRPAGVQPKDRETDSAMAALLRGPKPTFNAFEVSVEKLGSAIKLGLIGRGQQLPSERDLADMMGISRTTIREAIRVLTVQGVLAVRRGRTGGTFVAGTPAAQSTAVLRRKIAKDPQILRSILDYRAVIEPGVAALAAERAEKNQIAELSAYCDEMSQVSEQFRSYRELDTRFHLLLGRCTQSARLESVVADLHVELSDLMQLIPYSKEAVLHSNDQHTALLKAVASGKAEQARKVMLEHVSATNSFLTGLL